MNMSDCRSHNTEMDFQDRLDNLFSLSPNDATENGRAEWLARKRQILAAARMIQELGIDDPYDEIVVERAADALKEDD